MSCHDHLWWICSYTLIFREYPQLTHRLALQFLVMPIAFMHIILQTWSWLKSKNLTILVMGNNGIVQCKVTFVQASCFINGISDNNSIIVWKTFFFLQTCAAREYDVIKMLVLTDVFPRASFENRFVYLLFSSHLQTGRGVIGRHFHTPIWEQAPCLYLTGKSYLLYNSRGKVLGADRGSKIPSRGSLFRWGFFFQWKLHFSTKTHLLTWAMMRVWIPWGGGEEGVLLHRLTLFWGRSDGRGWGQNLDCKAKANKSG